LSALIAGGLLGYIFALSCIKWEANQIVSGAAINILAVGLTGFFLFEVFGFHGSSPAVAKMPLLDLPWMDKLPLLGHPLRVMIFQQSPLFVISILLVAFAWLLLYKTPLGLRWRAVGENPLAAETIGVRVRRLRYLAVVASGLLAALGGAQLSLGDLSQFVERMTAGRGFIALAALILGRWKPWQVLAACLFFGFADALADSLQSVGFGIPPELFLALPFILTIIVLAGFIGEIRPPAALGKTYRR